MMSLSETLKELERRGYTEDFGNRVTSMKNAAPLSPSDYIVDDTYRIDDMTDPSEQVIVYAISSLKSAQRGFLINTFGPTADTKTDEFVAELSERGKLVS